MSLCWILLLTSVSFGQISFHDTFSNKARERIKSDVAKGELIFVATVINVGPPPKFRSGGFMATQAVQYQIEEVLKGKLAEGTHTLEVHHVVIAGSQTGDPSPDANRLSQDMFAPGSHLIVIAIRKPVIDGKRPSWLCVDEDYGAIRATNPNVAAIKQLVSSLGGIADASARARGGHWNLLVPQDAEHPMTTSSNVPLELEPKLYWFYDGLGRILDLQIEGNEATGAFLDRDVRFFFRVSLEELNNPISLLLLLVSSAGSEPASIKSLPKSEDIFTIAITPIPRFPALGHPEMDSNQLLQMLYFTPESLRGALPNFRPGEAEIKVGARRIWESGVIVLNDKEVLFWTTCRKNFIHVLTPNGPVSFIIGDGKDNL